MVPTRAQNERRLSMNLNCGARQCAQHQPQHAARCGWVFDHSRAPIELRRFMVSMRAQESERGLSMNRPFFLVVLLVLGIVATFRASGLGVLVPAYFYPAQG